MNYVKSLNLLGVEARQNPSLTGAGAPTDSTEGAVGEFYMDTNTGDLYKCTAVSNGVHTWICDTAGIKARLDLIEARLQALENAT